MQLANNDQIDIQQHWQTDSPCQITTSRLYIIISSSFTKLSECRLLAKAQSHKLGNTSINQHCLLDNSLGVLATTNQQSILSLRFQAQPRLFANTQLLLFPEYIGVLVQTKNVSTPQHVYQYPFTTHQQRLMNNIPFSVKVRVVTV